MQVLKEEVKIEIEKAAKKLFLKNGFEKTSMKNIADSAGISKSNLYNYFPSKENIFYYLTSSALRELTNMLESFLNHEEFEFEDTFDLDGYCSFLSNKIVECFEEYSEELILLMDCSQGTIYGNTKLKLINMLGEHLKDEFNTHSKYGEKEEFIFPHIISTGLVEGIIQILRYSNRDNNFLEKNVRLLVEHHIYGYAHILHIW